MAFGMNAKMLIVVVLAAAVANVSSKLLTALGPISGTPTGNGVISSKPLLASAPWSGAPTGNGAAAGIDTAKVMEIFLSLQLTESQLAALKTAAETPGKPAKKIAAVKKVVKDTFTKDQKKTVKDNQAALTTALKKAKDSELGPLAAYKDVLKEVVKQISKSS
uniref:DUF148 domain-containing protein n=1 Tax=Plectus sambesii TaxID=2011161 RepID=A0A914XK30_9BILA